ncbi:glycoside hydrolase family 3 C-terminal domain-containing protein [Lachnospiraceae bacterium YH-ros2228]
MTVEEKVALVSGTDFFYTNPIPRLGIPSLCMSDGPHGLRKQIGEGDNGISQSEPATAFPTAATVATSWNPENARRLGEAIGEECKYYDVHTILGPGINIKRNPLCGRNFEYYSEDPLLAGVMGTAEVEGVQSTGVGVSLKHFALNNSENYRFLGNSVASENTIRNLYLKPFEYVVKHGKPATVMCAYNQINGTYCSENKWLLTDVLRDEWGFDGVVMSDWGAVRDRVEALKAGMDLEMPGDTAICRRRLLDALAEGSLSEEVLDQSCLRILKWINTYVPQAGSANQEQAGSTNQMDAARSVSTSAERKTAPDWTAHHKLVADIAADSAVLLENDGVLPLSAETPVYVDGLFFHNMRYQGAGSSMIHPTQVTSPEDAFRQHGVKMVALEESQVALAFIGLTDDYESEGSDREHMRLPEEHIELVERLIASGKKVVVVLFGGAPVELPFADRVSAILNMYLPGQNGGEAVYRLLYGEVNPSGKLAETWPMHYEDVPGHEEFGKHRVEVYREGCEVGYRYYNKHKIPVRYPFGYGLSYSRFQESDWELVIGDAVTYQNTVAHQDVVTYKKTVTNVGDRAGAQVVMLYLDGELAGFNKVYLEAGETKTVYVTVEKEERQQYSDEYTIPADEPSFPVNLESRFTDLKQSFMGRILFNAVLSVADKQAKEAEKMPEGPERDNKAKGAQFLRRILESNSPRSMSMTAGKSFPYNFAEGFVELTNGHLIRGAACFFKKIKVPKLPKEE